jgi:predicted nuclease of restriction endonuclease-like (RecB) superfamily
MKLKTYMGSLGSGSYMVVRSKERTDGNFESFRVVLVLFSCWPRAVLVYRHEVTEGSVILIILCMFPDPT